jgi:hypothetical protein
MQAMKFRITGVLPQVGLTWIVFVAVSFACLVSKSASSPAQLTSSPTTSQSSTPLTAPSAHEKTACTLTLSEAPMIDRLKLGMKVDEILALFPGSKDDAELRSELSKPPGRFGNSTFLLTPSKYPSTADFKAVSRLTFTMLDGNVSSFTVNYNGPQWPHVDKFVEKVIEGKNLPTADQWEAYVGMDTQMKTLNCTGFSIRVFSGGESGSMNYVLVEDVEADKKLKERRKKAREQAGPV